MTPGLLDRLLQSECISLMSLSCAVASSTSQKGSTHIQAHLSLCASFPVLRTISRSAAFISHGVQQHEDRIRDSYLSARTPKYTHVGPERNKQRHVFWSCADSQAAAGYTHTWASSARFGSSQLLFDSTTAMADIPLTCAKNG